MAEAKFAVQRREDDTSYYSRRPQNKYRLLSTSVGWFKCKSLASSLILRTLILWSVRRPLSPHYIKHAYLMHFTHSCGHPGSYDGDLPVRDATLRRS